MGPLPGDLSSEELHSVTGDSSGAASPLTARSMRLERVAQALAQSQEELRRYVEFVTLKNSLIVIWFIKEGTMHLQPNGGCCSLEGSFLWSFHLQNP